MIQNYDLCFYHSSKFEIFFKKLNNIDLKMVFSLEKCRISYSFNKSPN